MRYIMLIKFLQIISIYFVYDLHKYISFLMLSRQLKHWSMPQQNLCPWIKITGRKSPVSNFWVSNSNKIDRDVEVLTNLSSLRINKKLSTIIVIEGQLHTEGKLHSLYKMEQANDFKRQSTESWICSLTITFVLHIATTMITNHPNVNAN